MAPARKKSKVDTEAPAAEDQSGDNTTEQQHEDASKSQPPELSGESKTEKDAPPKIATQNRSSWYSGGSWRSKASPVAQVARESISVEQGVSSELPKQDEVRRRSSQSVSKSVKGSRKSIPLIAEPTKVHATSDAGDKSLPTKKQFPSEEKLRGVEPSTTNEGKIAIEIEETPLPPEPTKAQSSDGDAKSMETRQQSGPWFGWWSRPDGYGSDGEKAKSVKRLKLDNSADDASNTPLPGTPQLVGTESASKDAATGQGEDNGARDTTSQLKPDMTTNPTSTRSWFGLWSSAQNQQAIEAEQQRKKEEDQAPAPPPNTTQSEQAANPPNIPQQQEPKENSKGDERPKTAGWAFWSTDKPKPPEASSGNATKQIGELAVADTPSQSHPEAAQFNQEQEAERSQPTDLKRNSSLLRSIRGRAEKVKESSGETTAVASPAPSQAQSPAPSQAQTPSETPEASPAPGPRGKKPHPPRPNIILPSIRETYPPAPSSGYLWRATQYLAQTLHIPGSEAPRPARHPYISPTPPRVKRAIAIGIHGFFPAALLQKVLGQPTGTSIRFANYAAASIKQWCQEHQPEVKDVEIEKVALEGEGLIADRVTTLWKLLLNWLSHLRSADFILVAAHSQGVPVAVMLVAKLIQLGCLSPHVRVGICAMAGINLGPFVEYKSRLFGGTALELFDFCESHSKVSMAYSDSLEICLRHGVRVTFVGSLDDQLVSMESSLHSPLTHPYVSRLVFVDGRLHAPNFLTHLVIFAVKLRNLGVSDHGLLREISAPLAGSLVGGEGHSRVYDDPAVYQMAVEFALESTDVSPSTFSYPPPPSPTAPNATATDKDVQARTESAAQRRRASLSGYPSSMSAANHMRRGSLSAQSLASPGIAPIIAPYEALGAVGSAEKNPFVLPWAVRGMLEEEMVKRDAKLQEEVRELVKEFEGWRPVSKVLKDVRWRLEGVRSML